MKVLKKIVLAIVGFIALVLIIAIFVKKEYEVKREITINKPKQQVFDYVKFVKNQDQYNKWVMADPNMKKQYAGTDGTLGFKYAWDSARDEVGKGEEEIVNIEDGQKINLEIRFIKPFEGLGMTEMKTETITPDQTKVTWGMKGKSPYPMNLTNLFIDSMLGGDLEESLGNLKTILEK